VAERVRRSRRGVQPLQPASAGLVKHGQRTWQALHAPLRCRPRPLSPGPRPPFQRPLQQPALLDADPRALREWSRIVETN
jgi:hypothetical protein